PAAAQTVSPRQQAQLLEKQGRWYEACSLYDELLSKDRNHPELREAYRRCLRHFRQVRRLQDGALRSVLSKYTTSEALDLYDQVLGAVAGHYVERERVDLRALFQEGLQELRFALEEKAFLRKYLARVPAAEIDAFKARLAELAGEKVPHRARAKN